MMNFSPITSSLAAGMVGVHWVAFGVLVVVFILLVIKAVREL